MKSEWYCVGCGKVLGNVYGGEFYPGVPGENLRTSGPNLVVTCPDCKGKKTFYTSDPIVRAVYQLVGALAEVSAQAMTEQIGKTLHK